ncbi:MAG: protein kinase [Acidobacteriota bacterium]
MKLCQKCLRCYDDKLYVCPADDYILELSWPESRIIANKFQLEAVLAHGGMGTVYRARQLELDREVAVKILSPQWLANERVVRQFHHEAVAIARLDHVNIVPIYDYGTMPNGAGAYLVMRLVPGHQLREELDKKGALPLERAMKLMEQICAGVATAHSHGIVHCDLKPENILLERVGNNEELVQLVDFGIARLREMSGATIHNASTDSAIGTPYYMSPEQCCGERITHHTDIYSLAIILFEILTGRVPFRSPQPTDVARHHVYTPPPPPSCFQPDISPALDQVIIRALSKYPSERQQTVLQLLAELGEATSMQLDINASISIAVANPRIKSEQEKEKRASGDTHRVLSTLDRDSNSGIDNTSGRATRMGQHVTNRYFDPILTLPIRSSPDFFPDLSVLIVDDNQSVTDLLTSIVEEYGCDVSMVADGTTAWQMIEERSFDLIICDIITSGLNSWQLFFQIQQLKVKPLVVFITDEGSDEQRLRALEQGVEDYWPQPFVIAELQIRLKRLLQRLSAERTAAFASVSTSMESLDKGNHDIFERHYHQGSSYTELGLWEEAVEEFHKALKALDGAVAGKHHFHCCYQLGSCYQQLQRLGEARHWYYRALAVPGYNQTEYDKVQQALSEFT